MQIKCQGTFLHVIVADEQSEPDMHRSASLPALLPSVAELAYRCGVASPKSSQVYAAFLEQSLVKNRMGYAQDEKCKAISKDALATPTKSKRRLRQEQQKLGITGGDINIAKHYPEEYSSTDSPCLEGLTTLMIRNIPCSYSTEKLSEMIDKAGFADLYNWLHIPGSKTKKTNANLGYAFINFNEAAEAQRFTLEMSGASFTNSKSEKVLSISPAVNQKV